ncbi:MAG: tyrosine-type recombinase/integrase [Acidimicrobiales bacterium]
MVNADLELRVERNPVGGRDYQPAGRRTVRAASPQRRAPARDDHGHRAAAQLVTGAWSPGHPRPKPATERWPSPRRWCRILNITSASSRHLAQNGLVFAGAKRAPLRRSAWGRKWRAAVRSIGMEGFRAHDLRHTRNTLAAATGASTKELMARMGHASPRAALIYQHATSERDSAIAAALSDIIAAAATEPTADQVPLRSAQETGPASVTLGAGARTLAATPH